MSNARKFIDRIVEEQEQATVKVELSGTPSAVQKAIRQLGKSKSGIKKAVGTDVDVKISDPKVVKKDDKSDDQPKDKVKKADGEKIPRFEMDKD